jgi:hypothetical protein
MTPSPEEKLRLAHRLVGEVLTELDSSDDKAGVGEPSPDFAATCMKCNMPIHWAPTLRGKKVALDDRSGPYVLSDDGTAIYEGFGGYAYHYDGTTEGCPAQVEPHDVESRRPEWQDIYD